MREARLDPVAVKAGANLGSSNVGAVPNSDVVCSAVHKTPNSRARERSAEQVANASSRLEGLRGPAGSSPV